MNFLTVAKSCRGEHPQGGTMAMSANITLASDRTSEVKKRTGIFALTLNDTEQGCYF